MSTLGRTRHSGIADSPRSVDTVLEPLPDDSLFLTDEVFLFRVIGLTKTEAGEMVELEDCFGLGVVQIPITEPRLLALRVVMPQAGSVGGRVPKRL